MRVFVCDTKKGIITLANFDLHRREREVLAFKKKI